MVIATALVWILFSVLALLYALSERREAKLDKASVLPPRDPILLKAADQAVRNATFHVAIQTCFLLAGVLAVAWGLLSARFEHFGASHEDEYRIALRALLITGQALLTAKLYHQRKFRRRMLHEGGQE